AVAAAAAVVRRRRVLALARARAVVAVALVRRLRAAALAGQEARGRQVDHLTARQLDLRLPRLEAGLLEAHHVQARLEIGHAYGRVLRERLAVDRDLHAFRRGGQREARAGADALQLDGRERLDLALADLEALRLRRVAVLAHDHFVLDVRGQVLRHERA